MASRVIGEPEYSMNSQFTDDREYIYDKPKYTGDIKNTIYSLNELGRKGQNRYDATKNPDDFIDDSNNSEYRRTNLSRLINPLKESSNSLQGGRSRRDKRKTTRRNKRKLRSSCRRKSNSRRRNRK